MSLFNAEKVQLMCVSASGTTLYSLAYLLKPKNVLGKVVGMQQKKPLED